MTAFIYYLIAGGSIAALVGMYVFRHKTKHKKYTLGVPAILIVQVVLLLTVRRL